MRIKTVLTTCLLAVFPLSAFGQEPPPGHVLWLIPNFRTAIDSGKYTLISPKEKFLIVKEDSVDRGTVALAAAFGAESQFSRSQSSFGNGAGGYARYWSTAYADFAIGNLMTEGVFPTLLHQDPRYFRRGSGSGWSRLGSAVGQIFWTRTDSGRKQFNYSEIAGNSAAVAVSMAYYPSSRNASDAAVQLGVQVAVDMASNIVKEFWPARLRGSRRLASVPGR